MDWDSITTDTPAPPPAYLRELARLQLAALKPEHDRLTAAVAAAEGTDDHDTLLAALHDLDAHATQLATQATAG